MFRMAKYWEYIQISRYMCHTFGVGLMKRYEIEKSIFSVVLIAKSHGIEI